MAITINTSTDSITVTQPTLIKVKPTDPTVVDVKVTAASTINIEVTLNNRVLL
tara:strand:+ start:62 stop:220 length:159 start_codon:yes stop_codon:yes gene_type:complete